MIGMKPQLSERELQLPSIEEEWMSPSEIG